MFEISELDGCGKVGKTELKIFLICFSETNKQTNKQTYTKVHIW